MLWANSEDVVSCKHVVFLAAELCMYSEYCKKLLHY